MVPIPWVHRVEATLSTLKKQAFEHGLEIEACLGSHFALEDSWRRSSRLVAVRVGQSSHGLRLKAGGWVEEWMIFAARLVAPEDDESEPPRLWLVNGSEWRDRALLV